MTSPIQSTAAPHPASIATVFREIMDAAERNQAIAPTMDKIEAEYKHRLEAMIRPASPLFSHTPLRSQVLSDATVRVAQADLQLAKSEVVALEAKAEQYELEMSSI